MPPLLPGFRYQVPSSNSIAVMIIFGAIVLGLSGCTTAPRAYVEPAPLSAEARTALNLKVHDTVWQLVNDKHFDPNFRGVNWTAMRTKYRDKAGLAQNDAELYRVLNQMCRELKESHLVPLPPRRSHEVRTARRVAVGMGWMTLEDRQVVTDLIPGGPAEQAGVQPGWIVLSCEGRPLTEAPPPPVQPGQPMTFGFLDLRNEARTITFQPELLKTAQLVSSALPDGHRYLRFDRFDRASLFWLHRQLREHRDAPGIVVDLRENPGGYLFTAQLAIAQFFDHRVSTGRFIRRSGRVNEGHGWNLFSARYPGEVIIVVGPDTGSAAEIFSHVLQHEKRATVVGRRTSGAVVVSRTYPLPGGGSLQVPIQDYRGRDGQRLEGRGVSPDVAIETPSLDDMRAGRDPDLQAALVTLGALPAGTLAGTSGGAATAAALR